MADVDHQTPDARTQTDVTIGVSASSRDAGWVDDDTLLASEAKPSPVLVGEPFVGRFRILRKLGAGGMGVVYEAQDDELDRRVAIKLLHERLEAHAQPRILREARAMARVSHPNVVQVFEIGQHEGQVFIAMEYVVGATLRAWQDGEGSEGRPGWREVIAVYAQVGRGLAAVHDAGLVHRDFKPDNVLVGADGRARVLDFGLVRGLDGVAAEPRSGDDGSAEVARTLASGLDFDRTLTRAGARLGTPRYMSPEQHLGLLADARSDQFSFCVALYEGLYGARPFAGESLELLAMEVTRGRVQAPPAERRAPTRVHRAVLRGLASDPDSRWPSLTALIEQLERDPRRRARRLLGGVALAAAVGAAVLVARGGDEVPCEGAAAALVDVWDEAREDALRRAMLATQLPYAEATANEVAAQLDRYSDTWRALHERTCHAHLRGELSDVGLDLTMRCLDRRREELSALADVLVAADDAAVERAVRASASLRAPSSCKDPERASVINMPEDPAEAAVVRTLQGELVTLMALAKTGRAPEADERMKQLLPELAATTHRPLLAESALVEGKLALVTEDFERAERSLTRAYAEAEALGLDALGVRALKDLFTLGARRRERLDELRAWIPTAHAKIERIGARGRFEHADMLNALGGFHVANAEYDESEASFARCLELLARIDDPAHALQVGCIEGQANVKMARGDYAAALTDLVAARELVVPTVGDTHPQVNTLDNNIGMILIGMERHEEAIAAHRRALASARRLYGEQDQRVAASLTHIGHALRELNQGDDARRYYLQALDMVRGTEYAANIHEGLGLLALNNDDLERALEQLSRCRDLRAGDLGEDHPHVAWAERNVGETLFKLDRLDEAQTRLQRASDIFVSRVNPEHPQLVAINELLGRIALSRGDLNEARTRLERALSLEETSDARREHDGAEPGLTRRSVPFHLARAVWLADGDRERYAELMKRATESDSPDETLDAEIERWFADDPARRVAAGS